MALDPSEMDRISSLTGVPLSRLVDWKNRGGEAFELRCKVVEGGACEISLNTPEKLAIPSAVPLLHGDYDSRKEEDGTLVYVSKQGNTMGQAETPDGRPAFAVGYDLTDLDDKGRPLFKVYFGTAAAWFVKNAYHQKWNDLREVRQEIEPQADLIPKEPDAKGKERGRNPRTVQREKDREQQRGGGYRHSGGQGGGRGGGRSGGGQQQGAGAGGQRRGRRGGRGRSRGGGASE